MIYAYDNWALMPSVDLYDTLMMAMALNAAKDMYEKGEQRIKDFKKEYGDFMSPFTKDMDRYGLIVGDVRNTIKDLYARGIDPLRSSEGRALVLSAINNVNPAEMANMRANAKTGYAYLDALLKLRSQGKYSEALELFDIMQNGGTTLNDFSTINQDGTFNSWTRTSPIEATTLRDLTKPSYDGRTARLLSAEDFDDPRLAGKYKFDPKYEWTGYLYSDLLKGAPGASLALAGDPRAAFFRNEARNRVIAAGLDPTEANIEAQFLRDIADANTWALIDPTRKADEFALDRAKAENDNWLDSLKQARQHYYWTLENQDKPGDGTKDKEAGWNVTEDVYLTTLAKGAGIEYLPQDGVDANMLMEMRNEAEKRQNAAIREKRSVLSATGMFIDPGKISGLIQHDGKNGRGYFLNSGFYKNLHDMEDLRSSYKGWLQSGSTVSKSKELRKEKKQLSKDIVAGIKDWETNTGKSYINKGYRLKVVPTTDDDGNNTYSMVGEDNKWHTYALVRVYMSNGKDTTSAGTDRGTKDIKRDVPREGRLMALEVGLHSNEGTGTPDLSVSATEDVGMYGYNYTNRAVGKNLNTGFAHSNKTLKH